MTMELKDRLSITKPKFDAHELKLLKQCLDSGWTTQGPMVKQFEALFAARHHAEFAVAVSSCTAALHLAMLALGLGPGDEVIVPAFTWVTSANCAEYVGARAVFADVNPRTFNLDGEAMKRAITPKTRAVVVVHLFGLSAEMNPVLDLARRHHLFVIEDAACAIGTTYREKPVGTLGHLGCFSFHPRKVITTGEGGMVTTRSEELASKVQFMKNHGATGLPEKFRSNPPPYAMAAFDLLGYNLRMSDIQAAVGVAQMAKLDDLLSERKLFALRYSQLLQGLEEIAVPFVPEHCGHTFQSYVIRILKGGMKKRNQIMEALETHKIQTRPGTHAVHRLGYYVNKYHYQPGQCPVAAASEDTTITLPLFPGMTEEEQDYIVLELKQALR